MKKNELNKRAAIYYSAGIGDALLLTPLVNELKKDGYFITAIYTSVFTVEDLFVDANQHNETIIIRSKAKLFWFLIRRLLKRFDVSFVNYFASNKSNLIAASLTSKKVKTNKKPPIAFSNIDYIIPTQNAHDAEQNIFLYKKTNVIERDFYVDFNTKTKMKLPAKYIVFQTGAGNNETPYKIWSAEKWKTVIESVTKQFSETVIVLLGDKNEIDFNNKIEHSTILNLTGKTTLQQVCYIIKNAICYVGTDSGLMHLAAASQKATFSVWGASNENIYSYTAFNKKKHIVVYNQNISCRSCSSWINANTKRVSNPMLCPDFACLTELETKVVIEKIIPFLHQQLNND